jgi:hypothetical protein
MTPEYICDSCGSSFVSTEQVKRWQRLCPCGDGKLHRHAVRRMHVVDQETADKLYAVSCRLVQKLREARAKERSTMRQLQAVRKSVATMVDSALASGDPEIYEIALKRLKQQGQFMQATQEEQAQEQQS